jgi:dipeptide/tripeptide permease
MAEEILTKDRLEKFGPLWPVIPGAVVLLIGILVFLFHNVNGIIICYVGVMAMIVAGGHIWAQSASSLITRRLSKRRSILWVAARNFRTRYLWPVALPGP